MPRARTFSFGNIAFDGHLPARNEATVTLELRETPKGPGVSVCGSIWEPKGKMNRDILSGGQNLDTLAEYLTGTAPFDALYALWKRWHLNGMRAACEHQRAEAWAERPIDPSQPTSAYGKHFDGQRHASWNMLAWVTREEHPEGLLSHPCPTCGYKYGSAWLYEEIPADVMAQINALLDDSRAR